MSKVNEINNTSQLHINVIGGGVYLKNKPQNITITWEIKDDSGNRVIPDMLFVNNIKQDPTLTSKTFNRVFSDVDFTVRAVKGDIVAIGTTTARFVGPTQTVENSLDSYSHSTALSANQGRILDNKIENATNRFKGLFLSVEDLSKKFKNGVDGDWAIVGESIPAPIFIWNKNQWEASGGNYDGETVDLTAYSKKQQIAEYTDDYNVSKNHQHSIKVYDDINWSTVNYDKHAPVFRLGDRYDSGEIVNMVNDEAFSYKALNSTNTAPYLTQKMNSFTLEEAISFLPEDLRVSGQKISFYSSEKEAWMTYVFTGGDYTNPTYWEIFTNNIDPDTDKHVAELYDITEELDQHVSTVEDNLNSHITESNNKFDEIDQTLEDHSDRMDDIEDEILMSSVEAACSPKDVEILADRAYKDHTGKIIADEYVTRNNLTNEIIDITNQQVTDLKPGSVDPEDLSEATKQLLGNKNITNLPDEEDITVDKNNLLKFKDKEYSPKDYSGMGRKVLRKHYVNGVNTLTQHMINKPNTIYIIQYDYCLADQTIEIPENCVLQFEGGSFRNGAINSNNTIISSPKCNIFSNSLKLKGFWNCDIYPEYFGAKGDGLSDDSEFINLMLEVECLSYIFTKDYLIYDVCKTGIKHQLNIIFENSTIILKSYENSEGYHNLFTFKECENINIKGANIFNNPKNGDIIVPTKSLFLFINCNNVEISNCNFKNINVKNHSATPQEFYDRQGMIFSFINVIYSKIINCIIDNVNGDEIIWGCTNNYTDPNNSYLIDSCLFKNIDKGYSCIGFIGFKSIMSNCEFSNITYIGGSLVNLLTLYVNAYNNKAFNVNCNHYIDTSETGRCVNMYSHIYNNTASNCIFNSFIQLCSNYASVKGNIIDGCITSITTNKIHEEVFLYKNNILNDLNIQDNYFNLLKKEEEASASSSSLLILQNIVNVNILNNIFINDYNNKDNNSGSIYIYDSQNIIIKNNISPIRKYTLTEKSYYCALFIRNTLSEKCTCYITDNIFDYTNNYLDDAVFRIVFSNFNSPDTNSELYIYNNIIRNYNNAISPFNERESQLYFKILNSRNNILISDYPLTIGSKNYRPQNVNQGYMYYDTSLPSQLWWDGSSWEKGNGNKADLLEKGTTEQRPEGEGVFLGFQYFDTDIRKPIWWAGTKWVDATGAQV